MRGRLSPVIVRGTPLGLPTGKDLLENGEAALRSMPRGADLPYGDGEPMESPWHLHQMVLLIDSLKAHWRDRDDFFCGGNMFLYFSDRQEFSRDFRGPDFFVVNGGVDRYRERLSWIAWEENGRLPDLIVELLSKTTKRIDRGEKRKLYCGKFRVHEYICYDPVDERLEGWRRQEGKRYTEIEPEANGRMWCEELQLYLGLWAGTIQDIRANWLRFFTRSGDLVLTDRELAVADRARVAAEAEAEAKARKAAEAELARLKRELASLKKKRKK